jgi:hypothetical protein
MSLAMLDMVPWMYKLTATATREPRCTRERWEARGGSASSNTSSRTLRATLVKVTAMTPTTIINLPPKMGAQRLGLPVELHQDQLAGKTGYQSLSTFQVLR